MDWICVKVTAPFDVRYVIYPESDFEKSDAQQKLRSATMSVCCLPHDNVLREFVAEFLAFLTEHVETEVSRLKESQGALSVEHAE